MNMVLATNRGHSQRQYAMLWLAAYAFLLQYRLKACPCPGEKLVTKKVSLCCGSGRRSST